MTRGYDTNEERKQALSFFGKELARRSKSKCELSCESNVPLFIYEIPPVPKQPDFEQCLFLSENVIEQLTKPSKNLKPDQWRHLNELIWHELPQIQLMSVRILQFIGKKEPWATEVLEEAYLDEELVEKSSAHPIGT